MWITTGIGWHLEEIHWSEGGYCGSAEYPASIIGTGKYVNPSWIASNQLHLQK